MPIYKITQGRFVDFDGQIKGEGETIELSEAFAAEHTQSVSLVDTPEASKSPQKSNAEKPAASA
jgi:hypothetical protein